MGYVSIWIGSTKKTLQMLKKDHRLFLYSFLKNPFQIGSIIPSSKTLAREFAAEIDLGKDGYIVELGGGTGSVSQALLNMGISHEKLVIVERDEMMHKLLAKRFPRAHVLRGDAMHLKELLAYHGILKISCIISSLPLLSMPNPVRRAILQQVFAVLPKDGYFTQFTYGLLSPIPQKHMDELSITGKAQKRVWRNFPPAKIWRFESSRPQKSSVY
jgi:phosphatidylethanolamine/phosphatidyl-N-methylethanolamine N-methyltransferase